MLNTLGTHHIGYTALGVALYGSEVLRRGEINRAAHDKLDIALTGVLMNSLIATHKGEKRQ
jgi:hypothetical protein